MDFAAKVSPNDVIEPLRGDEGEATHMDINGDELLELLDEEEDDDLFIIDDDEMEETDDEFLVYDDISRLDNLRPLSLSVKNFVLVPNSEQGRLSEGSKALLFWREGENNFSDWKINVVTNEEARNGGDSFTTTYHVNKVIIARGPNRSEYFATLFDSDAFFENNDGTSTVHLPEEIAAYFPDFLDYVYALEGKSIIKFQNWKSMMWLANYFQVQTLQKDVCDFIERDMYNFNHMEDYLTELKDADEDDKVATRFLSRAAHACAVMILSIEPTSSLLKSIPPLMFLNVIDTLGQRCIDSEKFSSNHANLIILKYLEHNIEDQSYFSAVSDMMGQGLFNVDDVDVAGQMALDWFELMGRKGWKDDWFNFVCTTFLRRYLSSHEPSTELMERVVKVVPNDIVARLYRETLLGKPGRKKKIKGLEFRFTEVSHHTQLINTVLGTWQLPPIDSTDSISLLKFYMAQEYCNRFGSGSPSRSLLSRSWMMDLVYDGADLEDGKTMSSYEFTADVNLILVRLKVR
eukprot:scaffold31110_cov148-Skeletonema_menzelii.AAC.3